MDPTDHQKRTPELANKLACHARELGIAITPFFQALGYKTKDEWWAIYLELRRDGTSAHLEKKEKFQTHVEELVRSLRGEIIQVLRKL